MADLQLDNMEYSSDALAQAAYVGAGADAYEKVYDSGELAAATTSLTISSLDGDVDKEYKIILRIVNGYNGASSYLVRINNDSTSIYGKQYLYCGGAAGTDIGAGRQVNDSFNIGDAEALSQLSMCEFIISGKTGYVRTAIQKSTTSISGTTPKYVTLAGHSYNETSTNITSLVILASQTNGLGIGSRIILLKRATSVKYCWQEIYNTTLGAATTSVTISGLTGNSDVLYRLTARVVNGYNGAAGFHLRLNNDTGTNYGYQYLNASDTSISAAKGTATSLAYALGYSNALSRLTLSTILLFAKSGYVRTAIVKSTYDIVTTTVSTMQMRGWSWNNTADEITSLVILADQTDGLGIGTEIILERLIL